MGDVPSWFLLLAALPLGYLNGRILRLRSRQVAFIVTLVAPLGAWAILPLGNFVAEVEYGSWWFIGLIAYGALYAGWLLLGLVGYTVARSRHARRSDCY
jgi:hypothetical protein